MMRMALGALMLMHGFAHMVGFAGAWKLNAGIPYKTTVLAGHVNLGDRGIRALGLVWALAAIAFAVAGVAALSNRSWWIPATLVVTIGSLVLTLVETPDARIGALVNVFLLGALLLGQRSNWF
jgi:hypothetical protein